MYQPSGTAISFPDRTHSPLILTHTRARLFGPIRIGLSSGTNTVLLFPQPLANPTTSTAQRSAVRIGIHSHPISRYSAIQPRDERDRDLRDDSLKHGAFSSYQSS
jgi:hypothetical protein